MNGGVQRGERIQKREQELFDGDSKMTEEHFSTANRHLFLEMKQNQMMGSEGSEDGASVSVPVEMS